MAEGGSAAPLLRRDYPATELYSEMSEAVQGGRRLCVRPEGAPFFLPTALLVGDRMPPGVRWDPEAAAYEFDDVNTLFRAAPAMLRDAESARTLARAVAYISDAIDAWVPPTDCRIEED